MENFCKLLPKVELHAHINGSISNETVLKVLKSRKGNHDSNTSLEKDDRDRNTPIEQNCDINTSLVETIIMRDGGDFVLDDAFKMFKIIHSIMNHENMVKTITKDVIEDFCRDNVKYLELRTTPRECSETGMTRHGYVNAIISAVGQSSHLDIVVKILLSIDRSQSVDAARETVCMAAELLPGGVVVGVDLSCRHVDRSQSVDAARETVCMAAELLPGGVVVGVDLSGNPKVGDARDFLPILQQARDNGLKISLHTAETANAEETLAIVNFKPDRIGHGVCLQEGMGGSQEICDCVVNHRIPIEFCMTSNIKCQTVSSYKDHPFSHWYHLGHPSVLATDDKGVFQTTLSHEYQIAAETFGMSKEELWQLSYKSIDYCFVGEGEKDWLRDVWNKQKQVCMGS